MEHFKYNRKHSPNENFSLWFRMNRKEREMYNDVVISEDEGKVIFKNLFEEFWTPNSELD